MPAGLSAHTRHRAARRQPATGAIRHRPRTSRTYRIQPLQPGIDPLGSAPGRGEEPLLAFRRLYANLQLDSLWKRQLHLADVELEGPHTELLFDEKGQLNLASLFRIPPSESPEPEQPSDPFPLRIDRIQLAEGSLHFQDLRPSEPVDFSFDPLGFELHNLSTLPDDGAKMTLVATGPNGGRLDWEGDLTLVPITSRGHLSVKDIQLKAWWPYVRDNAPLVLENGVVSLSSDYRLDLSKDTQLLLDKAALKLADFSINSPQGKPLAKLASLDVAATTLDLAKQEVVLGEVRSQGLEAWAAREKDGQLDWQKLFADFTPPPRKAPAPKPAENTDPAAAPTDAAKTTSEPATDGAAKAAAIASGEASKDRPAEKDASVAETERATDDKESAKAAEGAADKVAKQETSKAPKTGKATGQETAKTAEIDKAASDSPQQLADTAKTPPPESTKASAETPAKPWHIVLRDAQLRGYKAHLVDRQPATEVPLEVGPLDLDLQNVDSLGKTPSTSSSRPASATAARSRPAARWCSTRSAPGSRSVPATSTCAWPRPTSRRSSAWNCAAASLAASWRST